MNEKKHNYKDDAEVEGEACDDESSETFGSFTLHFEWLLGDNQNWN